MTAHSKLFGRPTLIVLLFISMLGYAAAQNEVPKPVRVSKPQRPFCRVKVERGLQQRPAALYFETSQVTIRDNTDVLLAIPNGHLLDAMDSPRSSQLPYLNVGTAFASAEDGRSAVLMAGTALAWDVGVGISRLFRRPRHFVTLTYELDGDTRSETLQLSGRDAERLVEAVNARHRVPPEL